MARRTFALAVIACAAACWACSSGGGHDGDAGDGGREDADQGDGGAGGDGDADADDDVPRDRVGAIAFTQTGSLDPEGTVELRDRGPICGWQEQAFGECALRTLVTADCGEGCASRQYCRWTASCGAGECLTLDQVQRPLSAGTVTITGATYGDPATCSPPSPEASPFEEYDCDLPASIWWSEGDTLSVSAPGASFPPFSVDVVAPARMQLTTDTGDWTLGTFHGDADVEVAWQAGAAEEVVVTVRSFTTSLLECHTADDGSFVIPAAGLAELTRTGDRIVVTVARVNRSVASGGQDGEVVLTASSAARVRIE